jgi:hypothetical protein
MYMLGARAATPCTSCTCWVQELLPHVHDNLRDAQRVEVQELPPHVSAPPNVMAYSLHQSGTRTQRPRRLRALSVALFMPRVGLQTVSASILITRARRRT